jgi:SET domain-containing protein
VSYPRVSVRESPVHGVGVFAVEEVAAGAVVLEYTGERVSREEAVRREAVNPGVTYILRYDDESFIDGSAGGNEARFINHSCEPNCTIRREGGRAFIVAREAIRPGDELSFDYGYDADDVREPCRCGAPGCRGYLNEREASRDPRRDDDGPPGSAGRGLPELP